MSWREAQEEDIYEVVLRQGIVEYPFFIWEDEDRGQRELEHCVFFLSIKGQDPSDEFMLRFADETPVVKRASEINTVKSPWEGPETFGRSATMFMEPVVWGSDSVASVDWGWWITQRSGGSCRITVIRENGRWVVGSVTDYRVV